MCGNFLRKYLLLIMIAGLSQVLFGQAPEQDCFNALPICQNSYTQQVSYSGEGNNPNEIDPLVSTCLGSGEQNDVWYIFTVLTPGNLCFTITPIDPTDDYDWAVYNITNASCADIATNAALEVSCNFSGTPGATGANGGSGLNTQGAGGTPFNACIPVINGQTFVINVSNFTGSATGYTIDFSASTAIIFDNIPPVFTQIAAPACGTDTINLQFSENVLCNTVNISDFNIVGPGGPYTVTAVTGANCVNGGTFEDNFTLTVSPPITQNGSYQVQLVGPVQDNCGNVSTPTGIALNVVPIALTAFATPPIICSGDTTILSTNLSGTPLTSFTWNPGAATSPTFLVNPITTTTYTVTASSGAGCTSSTTVTVQVNPNPNVVAYASPQTICQGQCATLSDNYSATPGYNHVWQPVGLGGANIVVCPALTTTYDVTVTDALGCFGTGSVTVNVNPVPSSTFTTTSNSVCEGVPVTLTYTGGAPASAGFVWDFDGGIATPSGQGIGPYNVYWTQPGVKNVTLLINLNGCLSPVSTQQITVYQVPTALFAFPNNICQGVCNQIVYTGNASSNAVYNWDFGGGVICNGATGQGPYEVQWSLPGTYTVCLTVSENGCNSVVGCQLVTVLPRPTACISQVADQCLDNNCFNFSYCGTPNVTSYFWSMPGANPPVANNPNPTCVNYPNAGPKTIWMYVVDDGCFSDTAYANFNVIPDPNANFTASNTNVCQGGCLNFAYTGNVVAPNQSYLWNFGPTASPQFSSLDTVSCVTFTSPGLVAVSLIVCNQFCCDTMVQQIFVAPSPQVTSGPDKSFCSGDGPIMLDGQVLPGTGFPAFTYTWTCNNPSLCGISNPYVPTPMVNPGVSPMTYYFQATDANGCVSNIDSAVVTILPKPLVDAGPDQYICGAGNSPGVFLNGQLAANNQAPGPYHYSWSCNTPNCGGLLGWDTLPNPYVHPSQTTIYTLIVVSHNGCSSDVTTLDTMSTTTVWVNPVPVVDAGPTQEICFGETITMQGYATGAGPAYTYAWTPNDPLSGLANASNQNTTATPQFTTLYTLSATSNGCTGTDTMTIIVRTLPTASIEPTVADICQGDSVWLDGLADGDPFGTIYEYQWVASTGTTAGLSNPNSGTTWASPNTSTIYSLQVSSDVCTGFVDDILVQVKPTPIANILTQDTVICSDDTIQLMSDYSFVNTTPASPVIFYWTGSPDANSILDPTAQNPFVSPTQTTVYTIRTSVAGECPTYDEVTVIVVPFEPANVWADTTIICGNGSTTLHITGGTGNSYYSWTPSQSLNNSTIANPVSTADSTVTYYGTVYGAGCSSTDSVTITVHPEPVANYVATNANGCDELEVAYFEQTQSALTYIWNFGDGTPVSNEPDPIHVYTQAGTYNGTLTVVGVGGCTDDIALAPVTVSSNTSAGFTSAPLVSDTLLLPAATVSFTDTSLNAVSWLWTFGDGITTTEQNPVHTYRFVGEYTVTLQVTNEDGCVSEITHGPYVVIDPDFFFPNVFTPNGDGFFDEWIIQYLGTENIEAAVYDRWGKPVFNAKGQNISWNGKDLKGKDCADGIYYYNVILGTKVYNGNITLMR